MLDVLEEHVRGGTGPIMVRECVNYAVHTCYTQRNWSIECTLRYENAIGKLKTNGCWPEALTPSLQ